MEVTAYTYNDAHQLTKAGSTTYSYDANGNTTGSSSGWAFDYNAVNNQTTSITAPGGNPLVPTYGGADQTERRSVGLVTYATSALGVSSAKGTGADTGAPLTPDSVHPGASQTHYYTRDNSGGLLGLRSGDERYYYLVDGLGSVVALVDGSAQKVNSYSYDPYGIQLTATQRGVANPWRYASGYFDGSTGLTKFGARYYDPTLGRFTQRDPSGQDLPYTYGAADPVNHTDPTGLVSEGESDDAMGVFWGGLAAIAVGAIAVGLGAPGFFVLAAAGCAAGAVGSFASQHGNVSASGLALNCFTGGVMTAAGGVLVKHGIRRILS